VMSSTEDEDSDNDPNAEAVAEAPEIGSPNTETNGGTRARSTRTIRASARLQDCELANDNE
ncbi:hypothetical protein A2U01_0101442, partial [Trifolium medium]|nr:hypothetical protein [Trifolium medium]